MTDTLGRFCTRHHVLEPLNPMTVHTASKIEDPFHGKLVSRPQRHYFMGAFVGGGMEFYSDLDFQENFTM